MYHHKNLNNFRVNTAKETLISSHTTYFVEKIKHATVKSSWILKEIQNSFKNPTAALTNGAESEVIEETVAQEFFRLLYPPSPKTRWVKKTKKGINHYFILSKEAEGFDPSFSYNPNIYNAIENGSIRGFATVLLIALLLREVDLNHNNIGIDTSGNIIKIDGGLCFAHLKKKHFTLPSEEKINFTQADIESLPELHSYQPCNWVDLRKWREATRTQKETSTMLGLAKNSPTAFKQELYKTIMLICLLPRDLIYSFTAAYSQDPKKADSLAIDIIQQIKKLDSIAAQMPAFLDYRTSIKAEQDIIDYTYYLKRFNTMGKCNLLDKVNSTCHIKVLESIFMRAIKGYTPIKNLAQQLNDIPSHSNSHILIEPLKNKIDSYLTCPSQLNRRLVYKTLCETKDKILNLNTAQKSLITFSIHSLSQHLNYLEKTSAASKKRKYCMTEATLLTGAKKRKTMNFFDSLYASNDTEENSSSFDETRRALQKRCEVEEPAIGVR